MPTDLDRDQFVAMKVAEAWETWQDMLPDLPDDPTQPVPWKIYAKATERIARKLWDRRARRDKKRPDRTSIESLVEEPAAPSPDPGFAHVDVADAISRLDHELEIVVTLRLQGHEIAEIADDRDLSIRTVERMMAIARRLLSTDL